MGASITKLDSVVIKLDGKLQVKDANGNVRTVAVGDALKSGEELIITAGAQFTLQYADGTTADETSFIEDDLPAASQIAQDPGFSSAPIDSEIAALQAQILSGEDPTASLPDTAAGESGATGNEGGDFATLERSGNETLAGAGFDTAGFTASDTTPLVEEPVVLELTSQPTVGDSTITVTEINLPQGSAPQPAQLSQSGSLAIAATAGIDQLSINGVPVFTNGVFAGPTVIETPLGSLSVDAFDAATSTLSYTYSLTEAQDHTLTDTLSDVITLQLTDNQGGTATSNIVASILDDSPSGLDDANNLNEDDTVGITGNVLENDTLGADSATVSQISNNQGDTQTVATSTAINGEFGVLTIQADGSYIYQLAPDFPQDLAEGEQLSESFNYSLTDTDGDSVSLNLVITINGVNNAPEITSSIEDIEGDVVESGVIAGGNEVETGSLITTGTLAADDPDNNALLTWSLDDAAPTTFGDFALNPTTGEWTYTLNNTAADSLALGDEQTQVFTVTVTDEFGASDTQNVTITIVGTNDVPVVTSSIEAATGSLTEPGEQEAGVLTASNTLTASDVDNGASLSWSLDPDQNSNYGTFTIDTSGTWTFNLDPELAESLAENSLITETFDVTVRDEFGAFATQTVTITINGSNDAPQITSSVEDSTGSVTELGVQPGGNTLEPGTPQATGTLAADDPDNNALLTWSLDDAAPTTFGDFALNPTTGEWTYTLNNTAADSLALGDEQTQIFTVTVTDEFGASDTQNVTITIVGTNDVPVVTSSIEAATGSLTEPGEQEAGVLTASNTLTASDVDNGASLSWSLDPDQNSDYGTFTIDTSGTWTFNLDPELAESLAENSLITETFDVTVRDEFGAFATQTVTITINGSNDAPQITSSVEDSTGSVTELGVQPGGNTPEPGTPQATGTLAADDQDNNALLTWSLDDAAPTTFGDFALNPTTGEWTYTLNNTAADSLALGDEQTQIFTVTVTDEFGASDTQNVTITIVGTNDVPVVTSSIEAATGSLTEPGEQEAGVLTASNTLTASDVDNGASLSWSLDPDQNSDYGTFTIDTSGTWTFNLDPELAESLAENSLITETFDVTVRDEFGAFATQTVTITINGSNDAPQITSSVEDSTGSVTELGVQPGGNTPEPGTPQATGTLAADDQDNNALLTWSLDDAAPTTFGDFALNPTTGEWTYTLDNTAADSLALGDEQTQVFTVTVTDEFGASDTQNVTITIVGTNDVPVLTAAVSGMVTEDVDVNFNETDFEQEQEAIANISTSGEISFSDIDVGDTHQISTSYNNDISWSGGSLNASQINSIASGFSANSNNWDFTVSNDLVQFLAVDETITLSFNVNVTDNNGAFDSEVVSVTIKGTNDAPILTADTSGGVTEDLNVISGQLSDTGSLSFFDIDTNDNPVITHTYNNDISWSGGSLSAGQVSEIVSGFSTDQSSWDYSVSNDLVQFLAQGETITLSFNVIVDDQNGGSDTKAVTITITGTNDIPELTIDGNGAVTEDVDVINGLLSDTGALGFTDADSNDSPQTPLITSIYNGDAAWSGGSLSIGQINDITSGFSVDQDSWDFVVSNDLVQFLAAGETITLSFNVTVDDQNGGTDTKPVNITITGTNDIPVLTVDTTGAVTEDVNVTTGDDELVGVLTDSGALSFTDVDVNDNPQVSSSYNNDISWSGGTLSAGQINTIVTGFSADQDSWDFVVSNNLVQFLAAGETVTLSFNVTVDDQNGGTDTQAVTITITGTNDIPVLTVDTTGAVTEDVDVTTGDDELVGVLTDSGALSFTDVDVNDTPQVSSSYNNDISWSGGTLSAGQVNTIVAGFSADQDSWDFVVSNNLVQFLAAGETITLSFNVTVDDQNGGTDTKAVTITITGTNDDPELTVDASGAVTEDVDVVNGLLSDTGTLSFTDVDVNDTPQVSSSYNNDVSWSDGTLTAGQITAIVAGFSADQDSWDYSLSNDLVQFLAVGETITLSFNVTVDDQNGGTDTKAVTITITGTNDDPELTVDASGAVTEDVDVVNGLLSNTGTLSFTDVDVNDNPQVSSSYNNDVSWSDGTLTAGQITAIIAGFSADQDSWDYSLSNDLVQFLAVGETITLSFNVTVDDQNGGTDTKAVTITITGTNDDPELTVDASGAVTEDVDVVNGLLSDTGTLSFTDVDVNDTATITSAYNNDISWSGGTLTAAQITAITAGFGTNSNSWDYSVSNDLIQFVAENETITFSYNVTVTDNNGASDIEVVTITINGVNDAIEGEFSKEIWVPASVDEILDPYADGYPLLIEAPTDIDVNDSIIISSMSLAFDGTPSNGAILGEVYFMEDGSNTLTLFDFNSPTNLTPSELETLIYLPGDNGQIDFQTDIILTFTITSGTETIDGEFIIHTVPANSLAAQTVQIGDGSSPLTSGNDQDADLLITSQFADALNTDPNAASLQLFTDFQKSPFAIPIPLNEQGGTAGTKREEEVSVRLTINNAVFSVLLADNGVTDWNFDADSGLMKADIDYSNIFLLDAQGAPTTTTLADYITANPVAANDTWRITYLDNDGGSYQARFVEAVFTHDQLADDAITVVGTDDINNLAFGSTNNDSLTGANLDDRIFGREGDDSIAGLEGNDELIGGSGNDTIEGGAGNDIIVGGSGDDIINGGDGRDYIDGGAGNDTLNGGDIGDRDFFVWKSDSGDGSTDTVNNFNPSVDVIDLSDLLIGEENGDLTDYLSFSFAGGDTTIEIDADGIGTDSNVTIVLNGVDLSSIYSSSDAATIIAGLTGDNALIVDPNPTNIPQYDQNDPLALP